VKALTETTRRVAAPRALVAALGPAARLSKTDLTPRRVGESTDLRGVAGGIYPRREARPEAVWKAIYDQYRPASATDDPPREAAGAILSLADRFHTLVGLFLIGLTPTGSLDPYGLRRAAFGAVSIIVSRRSALDWKPVARKALSLFPGEVASTHPDVVLAQLEEFFAERLRNLLERRGHSYDEISAVVRAGTWDFADAADRAQALSDARRELDF